MLTLYFSPTSPYVRKVRIVLAEYGQTDLVDLVPLNPHVEKDKIRDINPLGKIPTMVLDDGTVLFESSVIVSYLDDRFGAKLFPPSERTAQLSYQALADGILTATISRYYEEHMRPESARWSDWTVRQEDAIHRGMRVFAARVAQIPATGAITFASIGLIVVLDYLRLRYPQWSWQDAHPELLAWYNAASSRESFATTAPPLG